MLVTRLREQAAGAQFGHNIELECSVAGNPVVRCHVECQNLNRRVILDDIAGKIAQQKFHHRDAQVDHWILISPHQDVADELRDMLDSWDQLREYPFSVQVWSPENRVREMFALDQRSTERSTAARLRPKRCRPPPRWPRSSTSCWHPGCALTRCGEGT